MVEEGRSECVLGKVLAPLQGASDANIDRAFRSVSDDFLVQQVIAEGPSARKNRDQVPRLVRLRTIAQLGVARLQEDPWMNDCQKPQERAEHSGCDGLSEDLHAVFSLRGARISADPLVVAPWNHRTVILPRLAAERPAFARMRTLYSTVALRGERVTGGLQTRISIPELDPIRSRI